MKALILTYLLAYGGAAIAPFLPFVGLCCYIALAILKPTATWSWAIADAPYARAVGVALIVGWGLKRFGSWDFGKSKFILGCLAFYTAWAILSMYLAASNEQIASNFVSITLKIFIPFLIGLTLIDSLVRLKALAWTIILSMGVVAFEENFFFFSQGRVPGGIGMNGIAHEMAAGVGLAIFLGLYSEKWWQRWLCFLIAAMLAHVPLMHMSRGGMLCLAMTGAITLKTMPKDGRTTSLTIVGLLLLSIIAGPAVVEEFGTIFAEEEDRDASAQSRIDLWKNMLTVALANPLIGIGPGHWPTMSESFGWAPGKQGHGLWVQLCAELGFVGGGLILMFYGSCALRLWRIARKFKGTRNWLLGPALGVPASVAGWLVEAQFGSFWSIETPFYLVLLGAATLRVISVDLEKAESGSEQPESSGSTTRAQVSDHSP